MDGWRWMASLSLSLCLSCGRPTGATTDSIDRQPTATSSMMGWGGMDGRAEREILPLPHRSNRSESKYTVLCIRLQGKKGKKDRLSGIA
ncbi:hypothetical protein BO70DRAFT_366496 [Aspergillus heteromorphus CBS 117.55]|uniref:Secreted protein n=1 Tax=Aspergillus heteromorphus CBS 117.55 TaxID=1448321 RepID=A0A317UZ08_9EURO|nr:uncharacterized protein BO70DRAFT_366496 [Aspergillus heteromorphus CBS 117.55]PWY66431.1 hypothetical protein BO70DRAFT_366496 [Aspergillus heteromorphus CBS 117.55]